MSPLEQQFIISHFKSVHRRLDKQDGELDKLGHAIHGNGQPGLKTAVDRNTKFRKNVTRVLWIILTPVLTAIGAGLASGYISIHF